MSTYIDPEMIVENISEDYKTDHYRQQIVVKKVCYKQT